MNRKARAFDSTTERRIIMTDIIEENATNISYTTIEDYVLTIVDKEEPIFLPNVIVSNNMLGTSWESCEEIGFSEIKRGNKNYTVAFLANLYENFKAEYYQISTVTKPNKKFVMDSSKIESIFALEEYYDMCDLLNEKPFKNIPSVKERFRYFMKFANVK